MLAAGKNQILFHLDGIDLVSRLIDGQFPNYQQVVPTSHTTRAVLDREELLRAVRPAALIAHESANIVKLQVGADGEAGITVSANAEVGDHVGQVEAAVEGDGTTIAFNARYLADVLTNVGADQFALELNGPLSPGVFKPIGDDQLHPRRHARADHVLDPRANGVAEALPGPGAAGRLDVEVTDRPCSRRISLLDLRGYASLEASFGPGPHIVWGPNAAGKTSAPRGDGPAGLGPLAPDRDRRRADPLGHGAGQDRGPRRPGHDRGRRRPGGQRRAPVASGSGSTAWRGGPAAWPGCCGSSCSPPRRCSWSPARRRSAVR